MENGMFGLRECIGMKWISRIDLDWISNPNPYHGISKFIGYKISKVAWDFKTLRFQILWLTKRMIIMDLKSKSFQFQSIPTNQARR